MIYLDHAATSMRKPDAVYDAVMGAMRNASGNPGRSGHQISLVAGNIVSEARLLCSRLFNAESAETIIFCSNGTDALNLAIHGMVREKGHVITSSMEHNSVARPLEVLRQKGVRITKLPISLETGVDPQALEQAICEDTSLVVMTHISNVTGTVNDISALGKVCRKYNVPFLVDAAQSAGIREIDVQKMNIDMLAFPGHKCLYGPQGTGGLYIRPGISLLPLKQGGTGSKSESLQQPERLPDRYESGTLNVPGIAGLAAGIKFLLDEGVETIHKRESVLTERLIAGLEQIEGVKIYGPQNSDRGPVVSITVNDIEVQDASLILDQAFEIAVRGGLHCAPDVHSFMGTIQSGGTIRISPGYFTTEEEIDQCIEAIQMISEGAV